MNPKAKKIIDNIYILSSYCTTKNFIKLFKILYFEGISGIVDRIKRRVSENNQYIKESESLELLPIQSTNLTDDISKNYSYYDKLYVPKYVDPLVTIIIPVFNQFGYTYNCISSIINNSGAVKYEIIIGDDCSTDLTSKIETIIFGIRVIHNKDNLRFLRNCNNAANFSRGKYILFLNNDTQVQKNWLSPLVDLIEQDEKNGIVGSKLVYPNGKLQEAGAIVWKNGSACNYGNKRNRHAPEYNYVKEVDYISGASIMIRKSLWQKINGFDESFAPAYYEDTDLAFEARKHGYKVLYQPLSTVVHFEGISNGTSTKSGQKSYQKINKINFYKKWYNILNHDNFKESESIFLARERGRNKKYLLMIDHYVPTFDKDAGSRCVYQYIKLFQKTGFQVKFIGDNFQPYQPYTEVLQQMGVEVLYGHYYSFNWKTWIKNNGEYISYVFLNRPHISIKYIDFIRRYTPAKIIYFGHDLHFLRTLREYNITKDKKTLEESRRWKKEELTIMRKADVVFYPSIIEKEMINKIDKSINVKVLPLNIFFDLPPINFHANERCDMMFIGGFNHKPNIDAVKWLLYEILPIMTKKIPNIIIHILGSNPPKEFIQLENKNLKIHGAVTDQELFDFYNKCRLVLVPLRYGAGIKGKVLEAMRFGVPVVTTSIGAEGIIEAEKILTIEDDAKKFAEQAIELYLNTEQLDSRSEASYQYIRKFFSQDNVINIIKNDF